MGVPSRSVMTVLILAAALLGVAAGHWIFVALT